jgi:hypothetical protein
MRWVAQSALATIFVAGVTTSGFSATPEEKPAPVKDPKETSVKENAATPTLDSVEGKKLMSIDGSLIALTASEGGLSREIVASNGAVQKTAFRFINDKLGTVTDSRDTGKVIGVFRAGASDIAVQYADGSSETVTANTAGGISIESKTPTGGPYCTAWYPDGHMFSMEDRKAALAQYAARLGLPDSGDKKPEIPLGSGCGSTAAHLMEVRPKPEAAPAVLASAGAAAAATAAAPKTADVAVPKTADVAAAAAPKTAEVAAAAAHAINVRTSEVHPIDAAPPAPPAYPQPPRVVASLDPAQAAAASNQAVASNQPAAASNQKGASSCLSVDSDGSHWGFRNHCAYTVQFAYCLMNGKALTSCKDGAVGGSVAANGFGALVADESLKETDAAHEFRWVACQGGAGEVIPRLDQTEPPSGRCVR